MDWWFFREGTEAEARDYLARFLDEGAAAAEGFGAAADLSLASVPEVVSCCAGRSSSSTRRRPTTSPAWVREVVAESGAGFRDFAEGSRSCVLRAAYYLGASFVTTYPVLRWELGAPDTPEVRQPVVTGFGSGDDLPVLRDGRGAAGRRRPGRGRRALARAVVGLAARHRHEVVVGAVGVVPVALRLDEARALVDGDRAPVERGDGEREAPGAEARRRVPQAGLQERRAVSRARQVRPQAEADVRDLALDLEDEEARQPAARVGGEVAPAPLGGIEQLGEVAGVARPVVERVLAGVAPARAPRSRRPRSSPGWRTRPRR